MFSGFGGFKDLSWSSFSLFQSEHACQEGCVFVHFILHGGGNTNEVTEEMSCQVHQRGASTAWKKKTLKKWIWFVSLCLQLWCTVFKLHGRTSVWFLMQSMLPHNMHFHSIENNPLIPSYTKPFGHLDKGAKGVPSAHSAWRGRTIRTMSSMNRKTRLSSSKQDVGDKAKGEAVWCRFPGLLLSLRYR